MNIYTDFEIKILACNNLRPNNAIQSMSDVLIWGDPSDIPTDEEIAQEVSLLKYSMTEKGLLDDN